MRARVLTTIAMLFLLVPPAMGAGLAVRTPDMKPVMYEAWNFSTFVPKSAVRTTLPKEDPVELSEAFVSGELIYTVSVTKLPTDTLTPTAIEQNLQGLMAASADEAEPPKRWEHARAGDPWKGISRTIRPDTDLPDLAPLITKAAGGRIAFQSVCMVGLGDDTSPVLAIGVIGPKFRSSEVEVLAKYIAGRTTIGLTKPAATAPKAPPVAKPTPVPAPAKRPKLAKGDIELAGTVDSLDTKAKSMTVLVDRITLPGQKPSVLYPARRKTVYVKSIPAGLAAGSGVVVIGKNTGVGKPITATFVERVEPGH